MFEFKELNVELVSELEEFLVNLQCDAESDYFNPHGFDRNSIEKIISSRSKDVYCLMMNSGKVIGYGLLRGWDGDYSVPSLGIAIDKKHRGTGAGTALIFKLHFIAKQKGSNRVRLRVHPENIVALNLYKKVGYYFEDDLDSNGYIIGHIKL